MSRISFQAGLLIGEMILAVNKDLLIDCNYDTVSESDCLPVGERMTVVEFLGGITSEASRRPCHIDCVQPKQERRDIERR